MAVGERLLLSSDWDLEIIHFYAQPVLGLKRSIDRGSNFTDAWYKSRVTKVDNLVAQFVSYVSITLDARWEPELLAGEVKNHLG
mgnify:FL=1